MNTLENEMIRVIIDYRVASQHLRVFPLYLSTGEG